MSGGKKQQKNRRDSIKDWRFHVLPPERLPRGSLPHQSTWCVPVRYAGMPHFCHRNFCVLDNDCVGRNDWGCPHRAITLMTLDERNGDFSIIISLRCFGVLLDATVKSRSPVREYKHYPPGWNWTSRLRERQILWACSRFLWIEGQSITSSLGVIPIIGPCGQAFIGSASK